MIQKHIDHVTKDDIDDLITNAVREGRTIEYKQKLPTNQDEEKKEFLADISSFANASGGDVIYGIEEARDAAGKPTGIPSAISGIPGVNIDQEVRRLENMIRDGIDPRVPGLQIKPIDCDGQKTVVLIRVPRSFASPHMVAYKINPRFFSRTSAGKAPLDVAEIRAAFVQSELLPEKIRRFREDRLGKILAGETPVPMSASSFIVLHVIPVSTFLDSSRVDIGPVTRGQVHLRPLGTTNNIGNYRLNLDGFVKYLARGDGNASLCYSQLFRNGTVEAVDAATLSCSGQDKLISSVQFERAVIRTLENSLSIFREITIDPPYVVLLSLLGVKDFTMKPDARRFLPDAQEKIDRRDVLVPEIIVEGQDANAASILRPAFDMVWQSSGFARSLYYNDVGEWKG